MFLLVAFAIDSFLISMPVLDSCLIFNCVSRLLCSIFAEVQQLHMLVSAWQCNDHFKVGHVIHMRVWRGVCVGCRSGLVDGRNEAIFNGEKNVVDEL